MNTVETLIKTTMEQLRQIVDVNTIVGSPIYAEANTLIVPVSRISFGFLTGGGDLPVSCSVQRCGVQVEQEKDTPFAGVAVAGVTVTPKAFLCIREGESSVLHAEHACTLDKLVENVPKIVAELARAMRTVCDRRQEQQEPETDA